METDGTISDGLRTDRNLGKPNAMPEFDASDFEANAVMRENVVMNKKRGHRYLNTGGGALPRAKRLNYRLPCSAYSETDTPSDDSPTTPRTTRTSSTYATISHERADFAASEQSESPSL